MERFLIEIRGKFYFETAQEADLVAGDVYSRIAEAFYNEDDIIDIEIDTYIIPKNGASD